MQNIELPISIQAPFGNLFRTATALIAVYANNSVILGGKESYPEGIFRLLGGGIEDTRDDSAKDAALSELHEEINLVVTKEDLQEHAKITVTATDAQNTKYTHTVYLYGVTIPSDTPLELHDDVDFIKAFTEDELLQLIAKYENLPKQIDTTAQFAWYDYGQMYAPIHRLILENLAKNKL